MRSPASPRLGTKLPPLPTLTGRGAGRVCAWFTPVSVILFSWPGVAWDWLYDPVLASEMQC